MIFLFQIFTIPKIQNDIESIGSTYAASVLDKMPQRPKKPLDMILAHFGPEAIDLVNRHY